MKNIFKIYLIVAVAILSGCTKDAEVALPEYKPTLVIHSYISPQDSGVVVYVNMSKSAYNSNYNDVNNVVNATVKISDGASSATLKFFPSFDKLSYAYYYIDSTMYKIIAGKTYQLEVSTPDGKKATASTKIPSIVPLKNISYTLVKSQFGDSVYNLNFNFDDPIGQDDYFKFGAYVLTIDTVAEELLQSSGSEDFGTYFNSDGKYISESMEAYGYYPLMSPDEIRIMDFRLMHVTREYYLYHQSIQNSGGGPFSEPNVVFTNITGGVGVFAGYSYDQRFLR